MAGFDYLPDQLYVPIGILDQAETMTPTLHCHAKNALSWVHLGADTEQVAGSARAVLNGVSK